MTIIVLDECCCGLVKKCFGLVKKCFVRVGALKGGLM